MADGLTTDFTDFETGIIIIKNVPCHKCTQCGEVSFSLDVSERLEQIVDSLKGSVTEVAIVKYSNEAA
jgi:YgiT-type zinc finger domain-containing protein